MRFVTEGYLKSIFIDLPRKKGAPGSVEEPGAPGLRMGKEKGPRPRPGRGHGNMAKPHALLVPLGCARRRACTCGLSTWCSPRGLQGGISPGEA